MGPLMDQILSTCFRLGSGLTLTSTGAENHQPQIDETLTLLPNGNGNWFGGELEKKKVASKLSNLQEKKNNSATLAGESKEQRRLHTKPNGAFRSFGSSDWVGRR